MQLVFTAAEFRVLVDVLLAAEHRALIHNEVHNVATPLLQRALVHDFSYGIDELEDLEELIREQLNHLKWEELDADAEGTRNALREKQVILTRVLDRVTEACAMA